MTSGAGAYPLIVNWKRTMLDIYNDLEIGKSLVVGGDDQRGLEFDPASLQLVSRPCPGPQVVEHGRDLEIVQDLDIVDRNESIPDLDAGVVPRAAFGNVGGLNPAIRSPSK